jgi:hypothetical protein
MSLAQMVYHKSSTQMCLDVDVVFNNAPHQKHTTKYTYKHSYPTVVIVVTQK